MGSKMLIDATHPEETRVVVVRGNRIEEFDFESAARKQLKGNIYLAKVTRVEPSLQAAFVEYGGNRHGFLAFSEIHPDYYQIPMADRQALIREQEEAAQAEAEEDDEDEAGEGESQPVAEADAGQPDASASDEGEDDADEAEDAEGAEEAEAEDEPGEEPPPAMALAAEARPEHSEPAADMEDAPAEAAEATEGEVSPIAQHGLPAAMDSGVVEVVEEAAAQEVDSVGAEDALEEVPKRRQRRAPRKVYKIQEVIKRRQIILVQVVKEERGNKGAALTTYLSLAGRYCVLMPNTARGGGISRKITDAGDRRRLKEVARDVEVPQGMGLIVRTAGANRTRPEIKRDFDYLMRLWENVRDLTLSSQAPALVYEEGSLIKRSIRDLYTKDVDEVLVEGESAYREAKDFMKMLTPSHAKNVKLYKEPRPLFARHQTETQLDALYSPTVTLPAGGYLVINQTEALVAIDINSGKATREHNIEDTALKTNLEACDEIARQLRLRDLAGLVVIDFIDMEENRNNRAVERRLKEALKNDRARIQVGRISHFGLMEMSRQRLRPGLLEGSSRPCPHCEGRGIVRSIPSSGLSVLRTIEDYLMSKRAENLTVKVPREVAFYVLNDKRDNLLAIEHAYGISVFIVPSDELKGSQVVIERAGEREHIQRRVMLAPVKMEAPVEDEAEEPLAEEAEADEAAETDGDADARGEDGDNGRRRRRRGRRGGRRGRERDGEREGRDSADAATGDDVMAAEGDETAHDDAGTDEAAGRVEDVPHGEDEGVETLNGDGDESEARGEERGEDEGRERRPRRGRDRDRKRGRGRDRGERREREPREAREAPEGDEPRAERAEGGDRPERSERRERGERHERGERRERRPREDRGPVLSTTPPNAAPPIVIPEFIPDPEPRKWTPPTATVSTETAAKPRAGWWSKRK